MPIDFSGLSAYEVTFMPCVYIDLHRNRSWMFRRADLTKCLYDIALKAGATLLFDMKVTRVEDDVNSIGFDNGESMCADLIIAADGVDSAVRTFAFPDINSAPRNINEVCFQWYTTFDIMAQNPQTLELWEKGKRGCGLVCGDGNYITFWTNEATNLFFMVTTQVAYSKDLTLGDWTRPGDLEELRSLYAGYCEPFQTVISKAKSCELWRVADSDGQTPWCSESGKLILVGDAVHAMPPNAAQVFE